MGAGDQENKRGGGEVGSTNNRNQEPYAPPSDKHKHTTQTERQRDYDDMSVGDLCPGGGARSSSSSAKSRCGGSIK